VGQGPLRVSRPDRASSKSGYGRCAAKGEVSFRAFDEKEAFASPSPEGRFTRHRASTAPPQLPAGLLCPPKSVLSPGHSSFNRQVNARAFPTMLGLPWAVPVRTDAARRATTGVDLITVHRISFDSTVETRRRLGSWRNRPAVGRPSNCKSNSCPEAAGPFHRHTGLRRTHRSRSKAHAGSGYSCSSNKPL
jgi:hypothetical protein